MVGLKIVPDKVRTIDC